MKGDFIFNLLNAKTAKAKIIEMRYLSYNFVIYIITKCFRINYNY